MSARASHAATLIAAEVGRRNLSGIVPKLRAAVNALEAALGPSVSEANLDAVRAGEVEAIFAFEDARAIVPVIVDCDNRAIARARGEA